MKQSSSLFYDRWPRLIARHPWRVLLGALLILVALGVGAATAGGKFADDIKIPGTQAQQARDLLQSRFPQQAGDSSTVVLKVPAGLHTAAAEARVQQLLVQLRRLPDVISVASPYTAPGAISRDGTIAQINVQYDAPANSLSKPSLNALANFQEHASSTSAFQIEVGGTVIMAAEQGDLGNSELYGLAAAIVILLLMFGSIVAMGLPIITAISGLAGGILTVTLLARAISLPSFTTAFAAMMGLGVGIDYALLIVTRFRQSLVTSINVTEAIVATMATAGRTVVFAGATVVVAMLGLWTVGIPFTAYLGTAAAVVVVFAVIAASAILPAILVLVGPRVDAWRIPGITNNPSKEGQMGKRIGRLTGKAPVPVAIVAALLMAVIAIPFFSIDLGSSDSGSNPTSSTTRRAYDLISEGFGPGVNGPIVLAVAINNSSALPAVQALPNRLRGVQGVAAVTPAQLNGDRTAATIVVIPASSPQNDLTKALVHRLRAIAPADLRGTQTQVYVGGATASFIDLGDKISTRLPIFFVAVIGLGFLILMAVFRSVLIPFTAALMNLLSAGAAIGVLVAVFQWGWFGSLIGVSRTGPIESFLPMMLFAILFGLSMDYEVFLVSRIQEEHLHGRTNSEAVDRGLALTMRLITAAAAIMVAVFVSFAFGDQRVIKEFGIGLSSAILVDALVVRLFLVPSLMHLFGEANWWFPRWLDRIVPNISIEGPSTPGLSLAPRVGATGEHGVEQSEHVA